MPDFEAFPMREILECPIHLLWLVTLLLIWGLTKKKNIWTWHHFQMMMCCWIMMVMPILTVLLKIWALWLHLTPWYLSAARL